MFTLGSWKPPFGTQPTWRGDEMSKLTVSYRIPPGAVAGIYEAYPRHVGRAKAMKAISQALGEVAKHGNWYRYEPGGPLLAPHEWLLRRVEHYARCRRGAEAKFTPYPATWFNQGRYDDDPDEWGRDSVRPQPSQAEENFRALERRWHDIPLADRHKIAGQIGLPSPKYISQAGMPPPPGEEFATIEMVGESPHLLRAALALWDKEQR